jgi:hypothetical protein
MPLNSITFSSLFKAEFSFSFASFMCFHHYPFISLFSFGVKKEQPKVGGHKQKPAMNEHTLSRVVDEAFM